MILFSFCFSFISSIEYFNKNFLLFSFNVSNDLINLKILSLIINVLPEINLIKKSLIIFFVSFSFPNFKNSR